MKKNLLTLFVLSALLLIPNAGKAVEVTISDNGTVNSQILPIALQGTSELMPKYSISQEIYLAEELLDNGAFAGDITAIKYYYPHSSNSTETRNLQVWIMESDLDEFSMTADDPGQLVYDAEYKAGTLVYQGTQTLAKDDYTITFNKNGNKFHWNGSKNIIITVYDETGTSCAVNRHRLMATSAPRFLHQTSSNASPTWNMSDLRNTAAKTYKSSSSEIIGHKYVNKITFNFAAAAVPPSTPSNLAASSVGVATASLSWSAVDGATSYNLYHSTSAEGIYAELASPTTNSYDWSGLTANTTYYVKVAAVNGAGSSALSDPISFTTLAPHTHDGITFEPWSNPSAMPTSGNYYLATDVAFGWESSDITLTGDLNLCLNGHEANLAFFKIVVPDDKTLAVYDNVGGGKITGFVASEVGVFDIYAKALIVVYNGAELDLHQGIIENTYIPDEDGQSYAIYSNGTLRLSGDVLINSNDADIYLYSTNVITLDGAISNAEKHTVYKTGGAITSGWSTYMSSADPRDYFESANSARSVCLNEGEASLRLLLTLSESSLNSSISTSYNQLADVNLTRSLVSSQYNTFCLPFALDDDQLQEYFGAEYDLEEFGSSSLEDEVLSLTFNKVTALEAGKPYLLKPSLDVTNPSFEGVTITATSPVDQTTDTYISFHATYAPTELIGGDKNTLFLGSGNELFYPSTTANIKAFRAYFEVKNLGGNAPKARIVKKEDAATGMDQITNDKLPMTNKILRNGEILILRDGKTYNVLGMECK